MTWAAALSSSGGSLDKIGAGTLILSGANTYSGATTISAGTLVIAAAAAASPSSTFTINVNNGLAFGAGVTAGTLGGLSGSGGVALTTADSPGLPVALTVGGNGQSTTYSGALSGGGGLVKTGSGTLTLFGANAYSGATTIANGTLQLAAVAACRSRSPIPTLQAPVVTSGVYLYYANMTPRNRRISRGPPRAIPSRPTARQWNSTTPFFTTPPSGSQACSLQANSSISQTVNFTAPGFYSLAWMRRGIQLSEPDRGACGRRLRGDLRPSALSWGNFVDTLNIATAGTHNIEFLGMVNNGGYLSAINNVSLSALTSGALPASTVLTVAGQSFAGGPSGTFDLAGISQTVAGLSGGRSPAAEPCMGPSPTAARATPC